MDQVPEQILALYGVMESLYLVVVGRQD